MLRRFIKALLTSLLFPSLVHPTILLTVQGDAYIDVYKPISWTRSSADPETFLLVNVVLDADATQGTQRLLETHGATSGTIEVVAHWPAYHILAFRDAASVTAMDQPLATSNAFGVGPVPTARTLDSTSIQPTPTTLIPDPNTKPLTSVTNPPSASSIYLTSATSSPTEASPTSPSATSSNTSSHSKVPIIAGAIVGVLIVIALVQCSRTSKSFVFGF